MLVTPLPFEDNLFMNGGELPKDVSSANQQLRGHPSIVLQILGGLTDDRVGSDSGVDPDSSSTGDDRVCTHTHAISEPYPRSDDGVGADSYPTEFGSGVNDGGGVNHGHRISRCRKQGAVRDLLSIDLGTDLERPHAPTL